MCDSNGLRNKSRVKKRLLLFDLSASRRESGGLIMGKVTCLKCSRVFDSEIEYRIHYSHNHPGPVLLARMESPRVIAVVEPVTVDSEDSYSLAVSSEGLGELYPVLKDAHNNIIDGYHRKGETPLWHEEVRPQIDTPVKLALAQLAVNFCRRRMSPEEIRERITFLAKNGVKADEIAKQTGIKPRTVYKYIPQEFKDPEKVEAARLSHESRTVSAASVQHTVEIPESIQGEQFPVVPRVRTFAEAAAEAAQVTAKAAESSFSSGEVEVEEVVPEGTPLCPCCGASMDLAEYREVKQIVARKFGKSIQTLLFPEAEGA
jgi:hypothetical protein